MIEVHDDPAHAESDGAQALDPASLETLFDSRSVGAS
jgi:3-deoxy-D-arabino-heptulosonate 7-phosphate (DAHP) synthase